MRKTWFTIVCISILTITSILSAWCDYPPRGEDYLPSTTATIELSVPAMMFNETIVVKGPTTIARGTPYDPGDGRIKIDTEIVSMSLTGYSTHIGPITVVESPAYESGGRVQQKTAGEDFPADSFFDVYIEIQMTMPPFILHNDDPVFMNATITTIPPWNTTYTGQPESVALKSQDGTVIGFISHVSHDTGPDPYPWYWKPAQTDYAPSGVPDFDQRQGGTYIWQDMWHQWSHCGPVAVANSLWWLDSEFEPNPIRPPMINDGFPLVRAYGQWDDHDPQNVAPLVEHLAYLMDTDGRRTGIVHSGTNVNDMEAGLAHYLSWSGVNPPGDVNGDGVVDATDGNIIVAAFMSVPGSPTWNLAADIFPASITYPPVADNIVDMNDVSLWSSNVGRTGLFYEHTVITPEFAFIEEEVKKCQDVVLLVGYWTWTGSSWYREPGGHYVTVAGVDSVNTKLALSDPVQDAFESGLIPEGRIPMPHVHPPPEPPYTTHNDTWYVSQDIYNVTRMTPPWSPCPGGNWMLVNFASWRPAPPYFAVIEAAVVTSPFIHDVAIINVTTSKTGCSPKETVGKGYICHINVTVQNQGDFTENINVTTYANTTSIKSQNITLASGASTILTFVWNTTGLSYNNYTISAVADTLAGEIDILDNTYTGETLHVGIPGDINGDGKVDVKDVYAIGRAYGTLFGGPNPPGRTYNPNCDINCDYKIDIKDYYVPCKNYGSSEP